MQNKIIFFSLLLLSLYTFAETKIKFATVAPLGTTWMNTMEAFNEELSRATNGRVKFIFFPGGIAGDEKDVLRKMRYNQVHAAGFTGVGMGKIVPEVRILDLPFFFDTEEKIDKVHNELFKYFADKFREKDFELIAWSEVGLAYLFSKVDISNKDSFKLLKMWAWDGDLVALETLKELNMNSISLAVADVLSSLETGLVNSVYTTPLAAIALQWNTKLNYMINLPLVHSSGAVLITKKQYDSLNDEDKIILKTLADKHFSRLTKMTRTENANALKDMLKKGIKEITPNDELKEFFKAVSYNVQSKLTGSLFNEELLKKINLIMNE